MPSVADPFFLAFCPLVYAALFLLVRSRLAPPGAGVWLDGLVAALATAALGAAAVDQAIVGATGGDAGTVATNLTYLLGDIVLLAGVVGVIALWPASMLLLAWAAWQRPAPRRVIDLSGWRTAVFPAGFGLLAVGVLVADQVREVDRPAVGFAVGALIVVIARMGINHLDTLGALGRVRDAALTDSLTGLRNRRALMERLSASPAEPLLLAVFDLLRACARGRRRGTRHPPGRGGRALP